MKYNQLSPPQKWIIKGIPILFIAGSLMHFIYDLSGKMSFIGAVAPVNESVWEHTKLGLLPVIVWYVIYYILQGKKNKVDINRWFTCGVAALMVSIITVPLLYYFYTGAFGVELLFVDIGIFFLAVLFGQVVALHFYKYSKGINTSLIIAIYIIIFLIFIVFTFYTPHLPLFMDGRTGSFGI